MKLHIGQSDLVSLATADRHRVLADMRSFGFSKVRYEVPVHAWGFPWQPYNWEPVRQTQMALQAARMEALPVLGAHQPLLWKLSAKQYGQWCVDALKLISDTTSHLPSQVEIWNEPNLISFWSKADPKTFYPYAQEAYDRIKAAFPSVEVVLAGMAAYDTAIQWPFIGGAKAPDDFVVTMLGQAKARPFFDRLAYHPYNLTPGGKTAEPSALLFGIQMLSEMNKIRPGVLVTEFGFSGAGTVRDADWLLKELELLDVDEAYLYCWRNTGGEKFGLVDEKNQPKEPYYSTVKGLIL